MSRQYAKPGLGVGLYYSPLDWRFPGFYFPGIYQPNATELREQYARQIDELASHYGKLDILWFDGGGNEWLGFGGVEFTGSGWQARPKDKPYTGSFDWQDVKTVAHLRQLQPGIILNDRTNAPADFRSREGDGALGDFDNQHPVGALHHDHRRRMGLHSWSQGEAAGATAAPAGGRRGTRRQHAAECGPAPRWPIDPPQAARLAEIGQWLSQYGESIYGTRGGPWLPGAYGVSTHNGKMVYVHVFHPPENSS